MLQGSGTSIMKSDRTVKTLLKLSHHAVNRHGAKPSQRVKCETDKRKCPKKFAESET